MRPTTSGIHLRSLLGSLLEGITSNLASLYLYFARCRKTFQIIFLRTTNKRRVSYILTNSQYSTHSDTNELWLPLRQLLERIKVVWNVYLYGFVTLLNNLNLKRE